VHHCTIQINHQPDATIFQFIILAFFFISTCFGRFSRPSSGAQWLQWQPLVYFHLWWQSCCFHGRTGYGKPEATSAVIELLMMGGKTPETCWVANKRQDNKLENCCICLVIYLNCTIYGLYETSHHHSGQYRRLWVMQSSRVSGQGPTINLSYTLTCNSIYLHSWILLIRCWITRSEETRTFNDETEHKPRSNYCS
jgi:hypothetical protein